MLVNNLKNNDINGEISRIWEIEKETPEQEKEFKRIKEEVGIKDDDVDTDKEKIEIELANNRYNTVFYINL